MPDKDDVQDTLQAAGDGVRQMSRRIRRNRTSPMTQVLAAIGLIAIGAIVVPALWGLVAEAPSLRRYMRIMRM